MLFRSIYNYHSYKIMVFEEYIPRFTWLLKKDFPRFTWLLKTGSDFDKKGIKSVPNFYVCVNIWKMENTVYSRSIFRDTM